MAWTQHKHTLPKIAASAIRDFVPVKESGTKDKVVLAATGTDDVLGLTIASAASPGDSLAVVHQGVVKARAVASLGAGAEVAVGSSGGQLGVAAGASGTAVKSVGIAQNNAAAGDIFSVLLKPRQISGGA